MKSIFPAAGLAIAFAVTVGAQSTTPTQTPTPEDQTSKSTMSSKKSSKSITLSGCLREGDEPNSFVLANVDMSSMSSAASSAHGTASSTSSGSATGGSTTGSTASGQTGTAGTSAGGAMDKANSVRLVGSANLKDHVGHQIEVTGMMVPQGKDKSKSKSTGTTGSAAGETTTDTTSRPGERSGYGDDKNMHTVNVRSVKMISASCSTN